MEEEEEEEVGGGVTGDGHCASSTATGRVRDDSEARDGTNSQDSRVSSKSHYGRAPVFKAEPWKNIFHFFLFLSAFSTL